MIVKICRIYPHLFVCLFLLRKVPVTDLFNFFFNSRSRILKRLFTRKTWNWMIWMPGKWLYYTVLALGWNMFYYEKFSHRTVHCVNHDRNMFILSMIETTPRGNFDLSQMKHVNTVAESGEEASAWRAWQVKLSHRMNTTASSSSITSMFRGNVFSLNMFTLNMFRPSVNAVLDWFCNDNKSSDMP